MLSGILKRFTSIAILSQTKTSGWIPFLFISLLPFWGYIFFDWHQGVILASFFIDRFLYVIFLFFVDQIHVFKAQKWSVTFLFQNLLQFAVIGYFIIGVGFFIIQLTGISDDNLLIQDILEISITLFILYGYHSYLSIKNDDSSKWKSNHTSSLVILVFSTVGSFLIAFFLGVFLVMPLKGTYLGVFFNSGYGVIIFFITSFRMIFDLLAMTTKKGA